MARKELPIISSRKPSRTTSNNLGRNPTRTATPLLRKTNKRISMPQYH